MNRRSMVLMFAILASLALRRLRPLARAARGGFAGDTAQPDSGLQHALRAELRGVPRPGRQGRSGDPPERSRFPRRRRRCGDSAHRRNRRARNPDARLRAERGRHAHGPTDRCHRRRHTRLGEARVPAGRKSAALQCAVSRRSPATGPRFTRLTALRAMARMAGEALRRVPLSMVPTLRWLATRICEPSSLSGARSLMRRTGGTMSPASRCPRRKSPAWWPGWPRSGPDSRRHLTRTPPWAQQRE